MFGIHSNETPQQNCNNTCDDQEIDGFTYIGSFEDSYYYHSNDPAESWFDAYNQSISLGGNLVTFSSLNEHEYVINLISDQHWIGLVNEGYFKSNVNGTLYRIKCLKFNYYNFYFL